MLSRSVKIAVLSTLAFSLSCQDESSSSENVSGQGGSMTRFAVSGSHLYIVDNSFLQVFSVAEDEFSKVAETPIEFGLETIFARGEYLYLGANDAMHIYSIADPDDPKFVFRYAHIVSCDPVVVQGNRAYVTLRSGSWCKRGVNAFEIIDISNPYNPVLIANYPMTSPHGLGVDGDILFICEGPLGLKMYDISDEKDIHLLNAIDNIHAYDVIPRNGILILTGDDGVFQYNYQSSQLELLSVIQVQREAV